jgi:hypothetical protein
MGFFKVDFKMRKKQEEGTGWPRGMSAGEQIDNQKQS